MPQNNKIGSYRKNIQYGQLDGKKKKIEESYIAPNAAQIQGDARRVYVRYLRLRKPQNNN